MKKELQELQEYRSTGVQTIVLALAWRLLLRASAVLMLSLIIMSCAVGDGDDSYMMEPQSSYNSDNGTQSGIFEGEWTVNKQVVDTARLEVGSTIRLRLPESYLAAICFSSGQEDADSSPGDKSDKAENEYGSFVEVVSANKPCELRLLPQGYSEQATFYAYTSSKVDSYYGNALFRPCSFGVTVNGVNYSIDVISEDNGNAIFRQDTGLWTIGVSVVSMIVTNENTKETVKQTMTVPINMYYNAKRKIR